MHNSLADQIVRTYRAQNPAEGKVKLDQSFLDKAPDRIVDDVLIAVTKHQKTISSWPEEALLTLSITGDSGAYCEPDGRRIKATLLWPVAGQKPKKYEIGLGEVVQEFRAQLMHELERLGKITSLL